MRKILLLVIILFCSQFGLFATTHKVMNEPDSVYLFSYAVSKEAGRSGLRYAWSPDGAKWFPAGGGYVKCDYGAWGAEKRMFRPTLMRSAIDGLWHCIWNLNEGKEEFGCAVSSDLMKWKAQSYFTAREYAQYAPAKALPFKPSKLLLDDAEESGNIQKVAWTEVNVLLKQAEYRKYKDMLHNERTEQDAVRFAGLKPVEATISVQEEQAKPISDKLIGIFFEDINYAADGGLYAELVQNRGFEYNPSDKNGRDKEWNNKYAWTLKGEGASFTIDIRRPIHPNNPHYALLTTEGAGAELMNGGFDGIAVKRGERYDFSLFVKVIKGKGGKFKVRLIDKEGKEVAQTVLTVSSKDWKKQTAVLTVAADVADATLAVCPMAAGSYGIDMVSLFPQKTFKGRKNGLRADLAQTLANLHPRFVRFPGGCVAHGDGLDNIYRWKNSIGALEARKPMRNLWNYHQSMGLGYFEYFQFCEDLGAEPLPVLAAGVPCQNSSRHADGRLCGGGQQGGVPMSEMDAYVQDILDLIEYANGNPKTSKWAKMRAEAGHPKSFNLKYIGIGNEDLITEIFEERFRMIYDAVKAKYPEVTVIGTVGPFYEGTDYEVGWELATDLGVPMVDEHYYNTPGWFINNQDFYDRYDRSKSKVYLGEYAAHLPGRPNNIETALAEALYLTSVERNGDVVSMTSYAPLLAKEGRTQWTPDLIYFNNTEVKPTVGYYTQQLYGQNAGDIYLPSVVTLDNGQDAVKKRIGVSVVRDSKTNDLIVKMVNLLPVSVRARITLPSLEGMNRIAVKNVLTGTPTDKQARPVTSSMEVGEALPYEMPAYSLTVIRIVAKKINQQNKIR